MDFTMKDRYWDLHNDEFHCDQLLSSNLCFRLIEGELMESEHSQEDFFEKDQRCKFELN